MKTKVAVSAMFVILASMLLASTASAQYANPCESDIARFCGNISPGQGRIAECLGRNEAQLSPACRTRHLDKLAEALKKTSLACESNSAQYCGIERQKQGIELLSCLRLNMPSLSPECKSSLLEALDLLNY